MVNYVMLRKEIKYILSPSQYEALLLAMKGHMQLDQYGETSISSIYFENNKYK